MNEYISPIIINACPTAGKGALAALLEGHPDILSLPCIHDYIAAALLDFKRLWNEKYPDAGYKLVGNDRRLEALRELLSTKTNLNKFEELALQKFFVFVVSSNIYVRVPFDLDFYSFEKEIMRKVWDCSSKNDLTEEFLFDAIFSSYNKCLLNVDKAYSTNGKQKYGVSTSDNIFQNYFELINKYHKSRIIYIDRDIDDAIASICYRDAKLYKKSFSEFIKEFMYYNVDFVNSMIARKIKVYDLMHDYPDRIKVIKFDEIILDTRNCMIDLSTFLDIPYDDILEKPTFNGEIIDKRIVGEVIDDYKKFLTDNEIKLLQEIITNFKKIYGLTAKKDINEIHLPSYIFISDPIKDTNGNIIIEIGNIDGNIFYGPYITIPPGKWNATFCFSNHQRDISGCNPIIHLDCIDDKEEKYFDKDILFDELIDNPSFMLNVSGNSERRFEFRAYVPKNSSKGKIDFNGVELIRINK